MSRRPARITPFPNGEIGVAWDDGHESFYDSHYLRCRCGCAHCIDEVSGRKVLVDDTVPDSVRVDELHPVGNYGLAVKWSDGHDTGIYTFAKLRSLCPCGRCGEA